MYKYNITQLEGLCEQLNDHEIVEMFEDDIDNLDIVIMMIKETLLQGDDDRIINNIIKMFEESSPVVPPETYEEVAHAIPKIKGMHEYLSAIDRSLINVPINDVVVHVNYNNMVIEVL